MKILKDVNGTTADEFVIIYDGEIYSTDGRGFMPNGIFSHLCSYREADKSKLNNFKKVSLSDVSENMKLTLKYCLNIDFNSLIIF